MIYIRVLKTLVRYLAAKDTATSTNRRGEADSPMFDSSSHAMVNCAGFSPALASFNRWKELGRHMKRGEKAAITLCMPITVKNTRPSSSSTEPKRPKNGRCRFLDSRTTRSFSLKPTGKRFSRLWCRNGKGIRPLSLLIRSAASQFSSHDTSFPRDLGNSLRIP
jgi:hypothetical protein